jgi:hypothetical protein
MLPANIDTLKSTINRRGGVARANRFALYMTNPAGQNIFSGGGGGIGGAISSVVGNAARSLMSGGGVSPTAFLNDPRDIYLLCESCTIPGKQIQTDDHKISMVPVKKPHAILYEEVTFTFHLTNDYYVWKYFKSWMDYIVPPSDNLSELRFNYKKNYQTDVIIQQMGSGDFVPVHSVKLRNAYPITMNAVELSNQAVGDTLRCTVVLTYDAWEEQGLIDGMLGAAGTTLSNII